MSAAGGEAAWTRAVLLGLVFEGGGSFLPPEASAQNTKATFRSGFFVTRFVAGVTFPPAFRNTTGTESFAMSTTTGSTDWNQYRVYVCAKTATPTNTAPSYVSSGCTNVANRNAGRKSSFSRIFTMTATMVTNGGVVIALQDGPAGNVVFGQWVPTAAPAIVLSRSTALPLNEGDEATYSVSLRVRPTGNVKVRVASNNTIITVNKSGGTAGRARTWISQRGTSSLRRRSRWQRRRTPTRPERM